MDLNELSTQIGGVMSALADEVEAEVTKPDASVTEVRRLVDAAVANLQAGKRVYASAAADARDAVAEAKYESRAGWGGRGRFAAARRRDMTQRGRETQAEYRKAREMFDRAIAACQEMKRDLVASMR